MQERKSYSKTKIYFSRWSRKSYAIFTSLGKDVKISRLSVDMCGKSLLKLNKFSMFFYEKIDYLANIVDVSSLKKIDISELIEEIMLLLNIKEIRVLPKVVSYYNIKKYMEDNS
jgi:hypothetical protein